MNKRCSSCRTYYPIEDYRKGYNKCNKCRSATTRAWYRRNRARARNNENRKNWGEQRADSFNLTVNAQLKRAYEDVKDGNIFQFRPGILTPEQCLTERERNGIIRSGAMPGCDPGCSV